MKSFVSQKRECNYISGHRKEEGMKCRRGETTYAIGWLKWGPN
jgi:hypothetical protein